MNLDQVFCAPKNCVNYKCQKMLSFSKVKAAESKNKLIKYDDFSEVCNEVIKKPLYQQVP